MSKQLINMIGGGFQHDVSSCANKIPKKIEWVKNTNHAPISIHIDNGLMIPTIKSKINYGWLSESKTIIPHIYEWAKSNIDYLEDNFKLIFTNDKSLLSLSSKFKQTICSAVPWVTDLGIHKKSKLVSMITSNKTMCQQHVKRVQIAEKFRNEISLFGYGYNPIEKKEIALKDYCFSIVIENLTYSNGYSEKISDCFATGTIPIYLGSPDIGEVFNSKGIIIYNDDLKISDLNFDLYFSKMEYIQDNYQRIIDFPIAEDYIYEKYIINEF